MFSLYLMFFMTPSHYYTALPGDTCIPTGELVIAAKVILLLAPV